MVATEATDYFGKYIKRSVFVLQSESQVDLNQTIKPFTSLLPRQIALDRRLPLPISHHAWPYVFLGIRLFG